MSIANHNVQLLHDLFGSHFVFPRIIELVGADGAQYREFFSDNTKYAYSESSLRGLGEGVPQSDIVIVSDHRLLNQKKRLADFFKKHLISGGFMVCHNWSHSYGLSGLAKLKMLARRIPLAHKIAGQLLKEVAFRDAGAIKSDFQDEYFNEIQYIIAAQSILILKKGPRL